MKKKHVLVLGQRKGLTKALEELAIPHTIWRHLDEASLEENLKEKENLAHISHVLASGEGSVVLSNRVRKDLGLTQIDPLVVELCSDKLSMKEKAQREGIKVTPFLPGGTDLSSQEVYDCLGEKLVVKDRNNSGGKGQRVYASPEVIASSDDQLIEAFIAGHEMSVESFIQDGEIKFVSTTKYEELGVINIVPSCLESSLLEEVLKVNQKVIEAFEIKNGLTHLEVYLTEEGVLFGEVALRPPGGHIMTLLGEAHGLKAWELYIKIHLGEALPPLSSKGSHAGVIVYHPGKGKIEAILGEDQLAKLKTLKQYKIRAKVGDLVGERDGVGKERAHFIFSSDDRQKLEREISDFRSHFSMALEEAMG
jgi:uncharacterized protein YeaC (DUF1315 family)